MEARSPKSKFRSLDDILNQSALTSAVPSQPGHGSDLMSLFAALQGCAAAVTQTTKSASIVTA